MTTTTESKKEQVSGTKEFKMLGFSALDTIEITQSLNQLLANYHIHYQKLRSFHWNVKGKDFFELHGKFEEMYQEAGRHIDAVAERIRVFGQTPLSTLSEYLEFAEISEVKEELPAAGMVEEVLADLRVLITSTTAVVEAAIETGDTGTEDMMTGYTRQLEKHHWMFSAWAEK